MLCSVVVVAECGKRKILSNVIYSLLPTTPSALLLPRAVVCHRIACLVLEVALPAQCCHGVDKFYAWVPVLWLLVFSFPSQEVPANQPVEDVVGRPVAHLRAEHQACGEVVYLDDMPDFAG